MKLKIWAIIYNIKSLNSEAHGYHLKAEGTGADDLTCNGPWLQSADVVLPEVNSSQNFALEWQKTVWQNRSQIAIRGIDISQIRHVLKQSRREFGERVVTCRKKWMNIPITNFLINLRSGLHYKEMARTNQTCKIQFLIEHCTCIHTNSEHSPIRVF